VALLLDLLPNLTFGEILRPALVTEHVREVLIREERQVRRRFLAIPFIALLVDMIVFVSPGSDGGWNSWSQLLLGESVLVMAGLVAVLLFYACRIEIIRRAAVTTAVVMDTRTLSLWGIKLFPPASPGSLERALEEEDEGDEQKT
jgi:hypothetical protein